jgi:phosphoserine phosphatase RsbU/P
MLRRRGIALRLILLVFIGGGFTVGIVLGYNYIVARRLMVSEIEESAKNLALAAANHVEAVVRSTEKVPSYVADLLEDPNYTEGELWTLLIAEVEQNPQIYGATIAFEPYAFDDSRRYFAPYFYRHGPDQLEFTLLGSDTYRYFYRDWYQIPKELGHALWSEPYYDEGGGNILMATYSVPFYRTVAGERRFSGVVTADVSLDWLRAYLATIHISDTGYAFLISKNGRIVTHPHAEFVMNETIFSLADAHDDAQLRTIGREMIRGTLGLAHTRDFLTGHPSWIAYASVPSTGWSLAAVFPRDELLAEVINLSRIQLGLAAIGGLGFLAVVILVARSITRPLTALATASEEVARGNLDATLPVVRRRDEVAQLTDAFGRMQQDLKQYLKEHDELLTIRHELDVARRIQESILPRTFPAFPERRDFDVFADMIPAQEVGGDFYDLFLIDDQRLAFAIGDVSGKGVPAALFMAVTRTVLHSTAMLGGGAAECLERVNALLCHGNSASMFVSLFYGILHTDTGVLEYVNAGHPHPYVLRSGTAVEDLAGTGGIIVGAVEGTRYNAGTITLRAGDGVFLYTDGVTEAMDAAGQLFTDARLRACLSQADGASPEQVVRKVTEEVQRHAFQTPQSDDITVLAVRYLRT